MTVFEAIFGPKSSCLSVEPVFSPQDEHSSAVLLSHAARHISSLRPISFSQHCPYFSADSIVIAPCKAPRAAPSHLAALGVSANFQQSPELRKTWRKHFTVMSPSDGGWELRRRTNHEKRVFL